MSILSYEYIFRAENEGWSTDKVRSICRLDWSNFRLASHFDQSNLIILKNTKVSVLFSCLIPVTNFLRFPDCGNAS